MPEHPGGPETEDLDARFRGLVEDVGTRSHGPGAERAVRTAGARRTALASGALVLVLVVAAGVGGWLLQRGPDVASPAAPLSTTAPTSASPVSDPDVVPALLTLDRLNEASAGWTTWEGGTADVTGVPLCRPKEAPGPQAVDGTIEHYRVRAEVDAWFERTTFASGADSRAAMRTLVEAFDSCSAKTRLHNRDGSADLEVVAFTWGTNDRLGAAWMVSFGNRMDVLQVVGGPAPSDDVVERISLLVAADVQLP